MPSKNQEPQANDAPNDPLATLSAELDGCRKSINYCIGIALGPGIVADKEALFAGKQVNDFEMCFRFMDLALKLMEASAGLGEPSPASRAKCAKASPWIDMNTAPRARVPRAIYPRKD